VAQAACCSALAPLITLPGVTLAAAAASAIRFRSKLLLSLSRKLERHRPLAAQAPLIALRSGVTLAAAAFSI